MQTQDIFYYANINGTVLRKCYGRHQDVGHHYGISVSQMTTDMLHLS